MSYQDQCLSSSFSGFCVQGFRDDVLVCDIPDFCNFIYLVKKVQIYIYSCLWATNLIIVLSSWYMCHLQWLCEANLYMDTLLVSTFCLLVVLSTSDSSYELICFFK